MKNTYVVIERHDSRYLEEPIVYEAEFTNKKGSHEMLLENLPRRERDQHAPAGRGRQRSPSPADLR